MTRRRWIADDWDEDAAVLRDAQAEHLARVLRAQVGQEFEVVAGDVVRRGVIESADNTCVRFSLHERLEAAGSLPLIVALSIIRFERMEWAIEKLTELGIKQLVPLIAQRSEKHLVQSAAKRVERWRKIARESAQQSRRSDVPRISDPVQLSSWLQEKSEGLRLLLSEQEHGQTLRGYLETALDASIGTSVPSLFTAIGPEGGWTQAERDSFVKLGWQPVSLGPRILRAETAAIAMASVFSLWLK